MANKPTVKQEVIKAQRTGKLFTAIIDKKKYTVAVTDEKSVISLKKEIDAFNTKNSEARKKKIITLLQPKQEKAKTELVAKKKSIKNQEKSLKKETKQLAASNQALNQVIDTVKENAQIKELTDENQKLKDENQQMKATLAKAQEVKPTPVITSPVRRGGEY